MTIGLLSGFMIGSLNKVWPWKETLTTRVDRHGEIVPVIQDNILPGTFETLANQDSQVFFALALAVLGFLMIWVMEKYSPETN